MNKGCACGGHMKSEMELGPHGFPIELFGHYYYRENFVPVRITIVEKGDKPGFYWCVKGHFTESEIREKGLGAFLIHVNRITL